MNLREKAEAWITDDDSIPWYAMAEYCFIAGYRQAVEDAVTAIRRADSWSACEAALRALVEEDGDDEAAR